MPAFDGTGPFAAGPRTGRGLGPCGAGFRRCFGRGWGFRRFFGWGRPETKKEQLESLAEYKETLRSDLSEVEELERKLQEEK